MTCPTCQATLRHDNGRRVCPNNRCCHIEPAPRGASPIQSAGLNGEPPLTKAEFCQWLENLAASMAIAASAMKTLGDEHMQTNAWHLESESIILRKEAERFLADVTQ